MSTAENETTIGYSVFETFEECYQYNENACFIADTVQNAQRQLRESAYYSIRSVRCDFHEGVLTLRGCLSTYYLKQVAQTLVAKVEGVQLINNRVDVPETSARS